MELFYEDYFFLWIFLPIGKLIGLCLSWLMVQYTNAFMYQ